MNSILLKINNTFTADVGDMEQQVDPDSDEALMIRYCSGSTAAFDSLYLRHKGGLYRFFLRQCGQKELAEELFQDVWIKLINARHHYEKTAKFTTYLYRIAHNRLIDHYRHMGSSQYALRVDGDNQAVVERSGDNNSATTLLEQMEVHQQIKVAIAKLPFEQREAFLMQQEGHLSLNDIAEIAGTTRETIKSRLRYAMKKLREQLGEKAS